MEIKIENYCVGRDDDWHVRTSIARPYDYGIGGVEERRTSNARPYDYGIGGVEERRTSNARPYDYGIGGVEMGKMDCSKIFYNCGY